MQRGRDIVAVTAILWLVLAVASCHRRPQSLPVVVSAAADGGALDWQDAHGPLRGEVPWVLRTDVLGPTTWLVVATADGDRCARSVSFRVLAGGATEYRVTLASDLEGGVSWLVNYGEDKSMKLFTCRPRPADDPRQECIQGGIPKPLFGQLVGDMAVELVDGTLDNHARTVRFERDFTCQAGAHEAGGEEPR